MQVKNWNDLRAFQSVAHTAQISAAARLLKVDATTVGRRLRRLESTLGVTLFERTREGQHLTEAGEALLKKVDVMAEAANAIFETNPNDHGLTGQVRLSVSEGFGSWFLAPLLPKISAANPEFTIDLVANSGFLSPSKREADIAVMLSRPSASQLLAGKLSQYALMLYASRNYLADIGTPRQASELATKGRLVGYIPDLLYAPELDYLNEFHPGLTATIRSSSINAQHRLLTEGAGIGVLPCFIGDREPRLVRVLPKRSITRTFWIVTHKDNHRLTKINYVSEWLKQEVAANEAVLLPKRR